MRRRPTHALGSLLRSRRTAIPSSSELEELGLLPIRKIPGTASSLGDDPDRIVQSVDRVVAQMGQNLGGQLRSVVPSSATRSFGEPRHAHPVELRHRGELFGLNPPLFHLDLPDCRAPDPKSFCNCGARHASSHPSVHQQGRKTKPALLLPAIHPNILYDFRTECKTSEALSSAFGYPWVRTEFRPISSIEASER